MARAYGARARMALAFETTYGTAPGSGYLYMPFASKQLAASQPLIDNELLGYGRDPLAPARDARSVQGDVVVPIDVVGTGHWLKALLGPPTTTGTSPKTHTYTSAAASLPSMAIEFQHPEVPSYDMYRGCRVNTWTVEMQRSGLLQQTFGIIAQNEVPAGSTAAGTPTEITVTRFNHFQGGIKRDTAALADIVSASFTYSNGLQPVEVIRADGLIADADPVMASFKGNIRARFASMTLINQAIAGDPCELEFSWTISANASLTVTAHAVYLPVPARTIPGPGGIEVSFEFQAARATSPARMLTAVLVNSEASYA